MLRNDGFDVLRIFNVSALLFVLSLSGCALMKPSQGTLQDTEVAISIWTDFVQPTIITYGSLPDCTPDNPNLKVCKDRPTWLKIKAAAWAAHTAIQAAAPVLLGDVPDTGQLTKAYDAITAARAAFSAKPATQ